MADSESSYVRLNPSFAFGIQGRIRDNVFYLDEERILYPVGNHIVIFNVESREMTFLPDSDKVKGFIAMAVSPNRKYLAVSEKLISDPIAQVTIINLQTRKRLRSLNYPEAKEIVSLSFSGDSKFLATQCSGPDHTLIYWNVEKAKILTSVKVSTAISRVCFNPNDNSILTTTGPNYLKIWTLQDGGLKGSNVIMKKDPQAYTDHCWVSGDTFVVATDIGEILVVTQGEMKQVISRALQTISPITSICPYSKGFLAAGARGVLGIFEKSGERDHYQITKIFPTGSDHIFCMTLSPNDDSLACSFSNDQLGLFHLANVDILKEDQNHFQPILTDFHVGQITGLDVCIRKPFVVTCGTDKSVRIWNYLDKVCELSKTFEDEPFCVSFHPSGFHLLVGFSDRLRLYAIVADDLKIEFEFAVKSCKEVRFSNGGQYFAAISNTNILIFSTYSYENIATFKGHIGPIRSICWTHNDHGLVSAGLDGAVYEWRLDGQRRIADNVLKACQYSCAVYTHSSDKVIACGSDRMMRELVLGNQTAEFNLGPNRATQLIFSKDDRVLYAGTVSGSIRIFPHPLQGREYPERLFHSAMVTRVRISPDDSHIFSVSDDGSFFILDVVRIEDGLTMQRKMLEASAFSDLILITKTEIEEKKAVMAELETKIVDIKTETEYQLHLKEQQYQDVLRKQEEEAETKLEQQESKYIELKERKDAAEVEAAEVVHHLEEEHLKAAKELENLYEKKLSAEMARYEELSREKEDMQCRLEEKMHTMKTDYESALDELKKLLDTKENEHREAVTKLREDMNMMRLEHEEQLRQLESEHEYELEHAKETHKRDMQVEKDGAMSLKGEAALLRKKFETFQNDQEQLRREISEKDSEIKKLEKAVADLEKTIGVMKKELRERNDTIGQKEKQIFELKQKNQELEKFRFVLDYKINELRKDIEPRDDQIGDMREQIKEMDDELQRAHRNSDKLDQTLHERNMKIEGLNSEISTLRRSNMDKDRLIKLFVEDLHKLYTDTEPTLWRDGIKQMYDTYVTKASRKRISKDEKERIQEFSRQREYMERSLATLRNKATRTESNLKQDFVKKLGENASLIDELNQLRREHRELALKYATLENLVQSQEITAKTRARSSPARTQSKDELPTPPPSRGRIIKGSTVANAGDLTRSERMRMSELLLQVEENNREIDMYRLEIQRLRDQVATLLQRSIVADTHAPPTESWLPPAVPAHHNDGGDSGSRPTSAARGALAKGGRG